MNTDNITITNNKNNIDFNTGNNIKIVCKYRNVYNCKYINLVDYEYAIRNMEENNQYICTECSKNYVDDNFFNVIDTQEKAYFLGYNLSDINRSLSLDDNCNKIYININNGNHLILLKNIICKKIKLYNCNFIIESNEIYNALKILFNSNKLRTLDFDNDNLKWSFIRGIFDKYGIINVDDMFIILQCNIYSSKTLDISYNIIQNIYKFIGIDSEYSYNHIKYNNYNCLDVLSKIYNYNENDELINTEYRYPYLDINFKHFKTISIILI